MAASTHMVLASLTTASLLAETTAWVAACTTPPSAGRQTLMDALIRDLKSDGIYAGLDWLLLLAGETEQAGRVNVANPSKVALRVNSCTFTTDRGFTGDAISMHLSLGEDIGDGGNWTLNSASAGVWCNQQNGTTGVYYPIGSNGRFLIGARAQGGNETYSINDATGSVLQGNTGSRTGHRAMARESAAIKRAYMDGALVSDLTTASTSIPSTTAWLLRHLSSGSIYCPDRLAAFWSGAGLDAAGNAAMHARLSTYLTAIGAN